MAETDKPSLTDKLRGRGGAETAGSGTAVSIKYSPHLFEKEKFIILYVDDQLDALNAWNRGMGSNLSAVGIVFDTLQVKRENPVNEIFRYVLRQQPGLILWDHDLGLGKEEITGMGLANRTDALMRAKKGYKPCGHDMLTGIAGVLQARQLIEGSVIGQVLSKDMLPAQLLHYLIGRAVGIQQARLGTEPEGIITGYELTQVAYQGTAQTPLAKFVYEIESWLLENCRRTFEQQAEVCLEKLDRDRIRVSYPKEFQGEFGAFYRSLASAPAEKMKKGLLAIMTGLEMESRGTGRYHLNFSPGMMMQQSQKDTQISGGLIITLEAEIDPRFSGKLFERVNEDLMALEESIDTANYNAGLMYNPNRIVTNASMTPEKIIVQANYANVFRETQENL